MKTFDDKAEGKMSIHRPKTKFTKYLILTTSFGEKFLHFYIIGEQSEPLSRVFHDQPRYIYGGVRTYVPF